MKAVILFIEVAILIFCTGFYKISKKVPLFLKEYNFVFTPQKSGCSDTLVMETQSGRKLKVILYDCKGQMHLECFKGNIKVEEGNYTNSLDLLKKYVFGISGTTGKEKVRVYEFYQPLRTGEWIFYDNTGKLHSKKTYKEGVVELSPRTGMAAPPGGSR